MNIEPNWTVTNQGPWQLIYNDTSVISLAEAQGITSTEGKVFVGTEEECEAERVRLGLLWAFEGSSNDIEETQPEDFNYIENQPS